MNIDWSTAFFGLGSVLVSIGICSISWGAIKDLAKWVNCQMYPARAPETHDYYWAKLATAERQIEALAKHLDVTFDEGMKVVKKTAPLLLAVLALSLAGCFTWSDIAPYVPPVTINPSAPTNTPPPVVTNTPPVVVVPSCGCSTTTVPYTGVKEVICNGIDGHNDIRAMINWSRPSGPCTWLDASQARQAISFVGNTMTVKCIDLGNGVRAHYLGFCQPSSKSTLVAGNPVTVGSGTLRVVFESRSAEVK